MSVPIRDALFFARNRLQPASDSASNDAQALLCAVLDVERSYLLAHPEQPLTPEQFARFEALVARCAAGEPLAYILGRRAFYDREFEVTPDVLVPRPETELLLEEALQFAQSHPNLTAVDVGTGSGALAVTLAALCPSVTVYAVDISPAALTVARRNAERYNSPVQFLEGDLLTPLAERGITVDLVMANLPYIATSDLDTLAVAHHEPRLALDGGADGLYLVRRLLAVAPAVCRPGALLLLEIGAEQGAAARQLAKAAFAGAMVDILKDYAGLDRIARIHLKQ